ncbi:hypothetical protein [Marinobacter sp. P4B1]|uniref:hypothetical protein n=1 Tax=Marinobacter sp. P4B1 TaxID=1119533 RepID=UPI00071D06DF|nr:hypothetical protein [Marinobacter sp. P4B1]KRW81257.1 hypothetical protein AQ621_03735 [Marinobacter sp. P4B1]
MKRLLISSTLIVALGFAGLAQADGYRGHGHPPGIQKQLERGKALPPGHQKKYLRSEWRDRHDHYRNRDDYRNGYRTSYGYDDRLPPEHRVARIIRDTQAIIEQTR